MAYDEELADRLRETLAGVRVSEKRMFGGLAFLVNGHLAVGASGHGGLLLRCDPARTQAYLDGASVTPFVMRGSELTGWLRVSPEAVATDEALAHWARVGVEYAESLPPKY